MYARRRARTPVRLEEFGHEIVEAWGRRCDAARAVLVDRTVTGIGGIDTTGNTNRPDGRTRRRRAELVRHRSSVERLGVDHGGAPAQVSCAAGTPRPVEHRS